MEAYKCVLCSESQLFRLLREKQFEGAYYRVERRIFFSSDKLDEWKAKGGFVQFDESASARLGAIPARLRGWWRAKANFSHLPEKRL